MTEVVSVEKYRELIRESAGAKYHNQKCVIDGFNFDSRLEAKRYVQLKTLKAAGEVLWFTRQVPFQIAPRVTYRVDFLICWAQRGMRMSWDPLDGAPKVVTLEDWKGFMTATSRTKIKTVEHLFRVQIEIKTKKDL